MKSSKNIIESYLKKADWRVNESSSAPYSFGALNKYAASEVSKDYWLREVYTPEIANAYVNGDIHIHDLGALSLYTYFGKETVIVKSPDKQILLISFEDLYALFKNSEVCVNTEDDVWQVFPDGYVVLDKDGWTPIQKITRKKKHRNMRFIKNEAGRSVIVTDNHPMITRDGEKASIDTQKETDYLYSADLSVLLRDEPLFSVDKLDLLRIMPSHIGKDKVYADGYPIEEQRDNANTKTVHTASSTMNRFIPLTGELGFALGFILAEGYLRWDGNNKNHHISINNKSKEDIDRVVSALNNIGCQCTVRWDGEFYHVCIANKIFLYIVRCVWGIKAGSYHKNFPNQCLMYSKEFLKGMFAGLVDGDGTTNNTQTIIGIAARTMLEQTAVVGKFLGLHPRDGACEGQGSTREYKGKTIIQKYPLYRLSFRNQSLGIPSSKMANAVESTTHWKSEEVGTWTKVLNNDEVNIPENYIYDITTETHTLLVNGMYNHNCTGYSLKDILLKGVCGVQNIPRSAPAKHFDSVLNQISNLITVFQNEIAGAVALNGFDTLLAPFIKEDNLGYREVKQSLQNFIFSINSNSRIGAEPAFSNITFDLTPPKNMLDEYVIIGGEFQSFTYKECQREIDLLNRVFCEIMLAGDADGKLFSYPIPTYNIHSRFDWDNPNNKLLWEMAGKYGVPYFANFVNSELDINDVRSMCPLRGDTLIDIKESLESEIQTVELKSICGREVYVKYMNQWKLAKGNKSEEQLVVEVKTADKTYYFGEFHLQPIVRNDDVMTVHAGELRIGDYFIYDCDGIKKLAKLQSVAVTNLNDDLYCVEVF